jgi:hypothetical protein
VVCEFPSQRFWAIASEELLETSSNVQLRVGCAQQPLLQCNICLAAESSGDRKGLEHRNVTRQPPYIFRAQDFFNCPRNTVPDGTTSVFNYICFTRVVAGCCTLYILLQQSLQRL